MDTLKVLERSIKDGLTNCEMDFSTAGKCISFKDYIGAVTATGNQKVDDTIPAGLLIFGKNNFISIPDTVFETGDGDSVGFYKL